MRGNKKAYKCKHCQSAFMARVADRARGWARFCSKSCKAIYQEKRSGQFARRQRQSEYNEACAAMEDGWDGHKDTF